MTVKEAFDVVRADIASFPNGLSGLRRELESRLNGIEVLKRNIESEALRMAEAAKLLGEGLIAKMREEYEEVAKAGR